MRQEHKLTRLTGALCALALLLLASCAPTPVAVTPAPPTRPEIWITADEAGDTNICVDLWETGSLWHWRCVPLTDLRRLIDKIGSSD